MTEKRLLKIIPDSINFRNLNIGDDDMIDVWATNLGRSPLQVRFVLPFNSPFQIVNNFINPVPPGFEAKASIKYSAKKNEFIQQDLVIETPNEKQSIPVSAIPPGPRFISDTKNINLGNIGINQVQKFFFTFSNIGVQDGDYTVSSTSDIVAFHPHSGNLGPNKSLEVSGTFTPEIEGDFEFDIGIQCPKMKYDAPPVIHVQGSIVSQNVALEADGKTVREFDFGTVFFGQKRLLKTTVVNHSPYKRSFVFQSGETPVQTSRDPLSGQFSRSSLSAIPSEGTIDPESSASINLVFDPPPQKRNEDDLDTVFSQSAAVEIVETKQILPISITGRAVFHSIELSSVDFDFGRQPPKSKTTNQLIIRNKSKYLPTTFSIGKTAHFRFEPESGTIKPLGSVTVTLVFFPKQLGEFRPQGVISFADGLERRQINLVGVCTTNEENKKFVRTPIWETDPNARYSVEHPDERFALGMNQTVSQLSKRREFDSYLTEAAEAREQRERTATAMRHLREMATEELQRTVGSYTEDDFKETLSRLAAQKQQQDEPYAEGLEPPDPALVDRPAPLYIPRPELFGLASEDRRPSEAATKADVASVGKKFKTHATTPAEVNECSRTLTPAQQLMVVASHQNIDFGVVSLFSETSRMFVITNNLQQSILVALQYNADELSKSSPTSQVIPPRQAASFEVKFTSRREQNFLKTISYTVNGHHTFHINVTAQVIPIDIILSKSTMEFRFSQDATTPVIREFLNLTNASNSTAEYTFSGLTQSFTMPETKGAIEPGMTTSVEIRFIPGTKSHDECNATISVIGGPSKVVRLIGDIGSPRVVLSKKVVNMGLVPIGIMRNQTIKLKNNSEDDAIFSVSHQMGELLVSPNSGRIAAREFIILNLAYKSITPSDFDIPVTVSICGAQPLMFSVTGQSELPRVSLTNNQFEFGKIFVGSSSSIEATISNTGVIPAILFLDLSAHPEFHIEYNTSLSDTADSQNNISLVSDPVFVTKGAGMTGEVDGMISEHNSHANLGLVYKVELSEGSTINFSLVFKPVEVGDHSFELPFTMMNVITSSSFHLQPIVSAEAVKAPLTMSTTYLDFGRCPLVNADNPHYRPSMRSFVISNETAEPVEWHFADGSSSFKSEPSSGKITPGASVPISIQFAPTEASPASVYQTLMVKTDRGDSLIGKIHLTGVGVKTVFTISPPSICIPPVKIGEKATVDLVVRNDAFIEAFLKVETAVNQTKFPISVTFPEGNQLQNTMVELPIQVSFTATKPMSFSTIIAIIDEHGNAASFTVSCTADNSVFTLYKHSDVLEKFQSIKDFSELKSSKYQVKTGSEIIQFFQRYLNTLVLNTQISNFPEDLINSRGMIIVEAVTNMSSMKKPQDLETPPPDHTGKNKEFLKKLLQYLQSLGCLLGNVKPEFLLSRSDFMHIMRDKVTKQLLGVDYFNAPDIKTFDQQVLSEYIGSSAFTNNLLSRLKHLESAFAAVSCEAWMTVVLQLFRVFVCGRIDSEKFNSVSGVSDAIKRLKALAQKRHDGDTVLSEILRPKTWIVPQEATLLKWANIYYCIDRENLELRVKDFQSLRNCEAIISLVKLHTNTIFHLVDDKQRNAIELASGLRHLKLPFCPKAPELIEGTDPVLATTMCYLFDNLQHYIPSAQLEFAAQLHKTAQRNIQLSNPSKSEITYKARMEGSSNFQLSSESITVAPGSSQDLIVSFTARSLKPMTARITMIPLRPRFVGAQSDDEEKTQPQRAPSFSAPVVVDAVSSVTVSGPDATYTVETPIFQPALVQIPVKNILGIPARFVALTRFERITDENYKPLPNVTPVESAIQTFIAEGTETKPKTAEKKANNKVDLLCESHRPFIVRNPRIELDNPTAATTIDVEFVPIDLGLYRCLVLLSDPEAGEIVYEIQAKANLPQPIEVSGTKLKCEAGKKASMNITIDTANNPLAAALAYSIERRNIVDASERKMKEMILRKTREIEALQRQFFKKQDYLISSSSPQYFEIPSEFTAKKLMAGTNSLPITFKPPRAGTYPCHIVLLGEHDARVFHFKGIGNPATKSLNLEFSTVVGRLVSQEIPLQNPSEDTWQFKVGITGDSSFTVPQRATAKPGTNGSLTVTFTPVKPGTFQAELTIFNITKEATIIYKLLAEVDEPPAEAKLTFQAQARQKKSNTFKIRRFTNTPLTVTTTVPIIAFDKTLPANKDEFTFTIFASRSGLSAGTIQFTDPLTNNFVWYIVEINVDPPLPEQTIDIKTTARSSVTISIPIHNPKDHGATFQVVIPDDDLFGARELFVPQGETTTYQIVVSPPRAMSHSAPVYFYSDDDGEFWYCLRIESTEAPAQTLAPINAPVGKTESTFVLLENATDRQALFRIENTNSTSFKVVSKRVVQLQPKESRRIEIRYYPTAVGSRDEATISFKSTDTGDWVYHVSGTGKPPQPQSPTIVTAQAGTANSALILFNNPFPRAGRFNITLADDKEGVFSFLLKKRTFLLTQLGEELQVPFTFSPKSPGQYSAHIILSLGDDESSIRWVFPVIGNALALAANDIKHIKTRSGEVHETKMNLTLVGETELFKPEEYTVSVRADQDFARSSLDLRVQSVSKEAEAVMIAIASRFAPQRPFSATSSVVVRNPIGQEWVFPLELSVEPGKAIKTIVIESLLNKVAHEKVRAPTPFRSTVPFRAYFTHSSATEFSVVPDHGIIDAGALDPSLFPVDVVFAPKMYGKLLRGVLVIDTPDAQYIYDVIGKTPEYVPPSILKGTLPSHRSSSVCKSATAPRKRNIIKENIQKAKIAKPEVRPPVHFR